MSDESCFLSLAFGGALGFVWALNKSLSVKERRKGLVSFVFDFTFVTAAVVLSYILSIPISGGGIRFIQAALELISALAFFLTFSSFFAFVRLHLVFPITAFFYRILRIFTPIHLKLTEYAIKTKTNTKYDKKTS